MLQQSKRTIFILLGWLSMIVGFVGAYLPILPSTCFFILAGYFFSKSSPRWHQWLLNRPHIGPILIDWNEHGVIRRKYKIMSTAVMVPTFAVSFYLVRDIKLVVVILGAILISLQIFIWTRPQNAKKAT